MNVFILTSIAMLCYGTGTILSKTYANTGSWKFGFLSILSYAVVSTLWLFTLRVKNNLAIMSTIWDVLYVIIAVALGVIVFKEQLNLYNYVGLGLAVLALVFLCK